MVNPGAEHLYHVIDRVVAPGDGALISEFLSGLGGQEIRGCRVSYHSVSLFFGARIASDSLDACRREDLFRFPWRIVVWECLYRLTLGSGDVIMRTDVDVDAVFCSRMADLVGRLVEAVRFDAESMSLCLTVEGGARLALEPDPAGEREDPQWDVFLPDQRVVLVFGERRWALEASQHTDRVIAEGDAEFIVELLTPPYIGPACSAWRRGCGRTGSLHFGRLAKRRILPKGAVQKEEGGTIIDLGDCDRRLTFGGADVVDSRLDGDEAVLARMAELRDRTIESTRLDPETLSLSLQFSDDVVLELLTRQDASLENEQWSIQLFDGRAVAVFGRRRWKLGPASATAYWNDPDSSLYCAG